MKAVIQAGGRGTRMRPYTMVLPKPLIPVGDAPIVETIVRQLCGAGFTDIVIACGYLGNLIQAYLDQNEVSSMASIAYHFEEEPLGTAGALATIPGLDGTFLAINGDVLTGLDPGRLVAHHRDRDAALTIAVVSKSVDVALGVLTLDDEGVISGYEEKPTIELAASAGIYVYEPRVLEYIEPGRYLDFPALVQRLLDAGERVVGMPVTEYWSDLGNPADYERAVEEFEARRGEILPDR